MGGDAKNRPAKTLRVCEMFHSIQGESTWAGLPCFFIRLTGCNLRCVWCDTAYSFDEGKHMSLAAILDAVKRAGCPLVEITGGEPLAQRACGDLAALLLDAGYTVLVETGGSLPIDRLPEQAIKIMDLKCPDSGMCDKNHWPNLELLHPDRDEVKLVCASRRDYEWGREVLRDHALHERCRAVLFSPVHGRLDPKELAAWMLADGLPARLQLQLHKYIWPPDRRGV